MKRTTIKLDDEVDARLRHEAALRGVTVSELTREAIGTFLGVREEREFYSIGSGSSGEPVTAERIEDLLAEAARRSTP